MKDFLKKDYSIALQCILNSIESLIFGFDKDFIRKLILQGG